MRLAVALIALLSSVGSAAMRTGCSQCRWNCVDPCTEAYRAHMCSVHGGGSGAFRVNCGQNDKGGQDRRGSKGVSNAQKMQDMTAVGVGAVDLIRALSTPPPAETPEQRMMRLEKLQRARDAIDRGSGTQKQLSDSSDALRARLKAVQASGAAEARVPPECAGALNTAWDAMRTAGQEAKDNAVAGLGKEFGLDMGDADGGLAELGRVKGDAEKFSMIRKTYDKSKKWREDIADDSKQLKTLQQCVDRHRGSLDKINGCYRTFFGKVKEHLRDFWDIVNKDGGIAKAADRAIEAGKVLEGLTGRLEKAFEGGAAGGVSCLGKG